MKKLQENPDARFRSVKGMMSEMNMNRNSVMQIATEAEAVVRYGKRGIRIDAERVYAHLQKGMGANDRS